MPSASQRSRFFPWVWGQASAQEAAYPSKPITVLVGYPPGGSTDLTGRAVADQLARKLGVPVIVENASGAGGAIAAMKVSKAQPDGYTLLLGANNEIAINRLITPATVKYSYKDFTPVGLVASQPMVLVASARHGSQGCQPVPRARSKPSRGGSVTAAPESERHCTWRGRWSRSRGDCS